MLRGLLDPKSVVMVCALVVFSALGYWAADRHNKAVADTRTAIPAEDRILNEMVVPRQTEARRSNTALQKVSVGIKCIAIYFYYCIIMKPCQF